MYEKRIVVSYLHTPEFLWGANRRTYVKMFHRRLVKRYKMFLPGYRWDNDKLCSWAKETQRLIAREWKPSVATWRHHSAPDATVSGLGFRQYSASWGFGCVCWCLVECRFGAAAGLVSRLGEADYWFVGARSVVLQGWWRRAGRRSGAPGRQVLCRCAAIASCLGITSVPLGPPPLLNETPVVWMCPLSRQAPSRTRARHRGMWNRRLEYGCVTCTRFLSVKFI